MIVTKTLNPQPVLVHMNLYFKDTNFSYKDTISDIVVQRVIDADDEKYIKIMVTTTMPGVLIGKGGRYITELTEYLNKVIKPDYPFKIFITENQLWYNNYKNLDKYLKEY